MAKIVKNTTVSDIEISAAGETIPASGQITISEKQYLKWSQDDVIVEITPYINTEDLVINDGIDDIIPGNGFSLQRAVDYLKYPHFAFNIRFEAQPERANGFVSKNVQEAIEEAKATIEGKIAVLPTFLNNGNTSNKWLALDGSFDSSNQLPAITTYNSKLAGLTFINKTVSAETDIEIYRNEVLVYTWEIRDKLWAAKTDGLSTVLFSAGDRISCFARNVAGGTTPNSVIVNLFVQGTDNLVGEFGGNTLN